MHSNIEHTKRSQYGIANLRGEVDVLCLNVDSATIWVIEVKDPSEPFSQRRIGNIVANFNKPDGYVDKLLGKTSDIKASASTVVKTLAPDHQNRDWQTRPLIVTRNVCPAAFVKRASCRLLAHCRIYQKRSWMRLPLLDRASNPLRVPRANPAPREWLCRCRCCGTRTPGVNERS